MSKVCPDWHVPILELPPLEAWEKVKAVASKNTDCGKCTDPAVIAQQLIVVIMVGEKLKREVSNLRAALNVSYYEHGSLLRDAAALIREYCDCEPVALALEKKAALENAARDGQAPRPKEVVKDISGAVWNAEEEGPPDEQTPKTQCPRCGEWIEDHDGFGVLAHKECGYCCHPSGDLDTCGICGGSMDDKTHTWGAAAQLRTDECEQERTPGAPAGEEVKHCRCGEPGEANSCNLCNRNANTERKAGG
jgi:hypothetical protein